MGMFNLLGATTNVGNSAITKLITDIAGPIKYVAIGIMALLAMAAIIFAIYVGFRLAKAEDEGKRKEAKQQLLWSIIAVIAAIALFTIMLFVKPVASDYTKYHDEVKNGGDVGKVVNDLILSISTAFTALFDLFTIGAVLFAVYIAVRLAIAQDEGKRKEAKKQLIWTLIAVLGVVIISTVVDGVISTLIGKLG